jgi:hypothetical protein
VRVARAGGTAIALLIHWFNQFAEEVSVSLRRSLPFAAIVAVGSLAPKLAAAQAAPAAQGTPAPRAAGAPLAPPEATVLAIDSGDLVVDLGTNKGVKEGQIVELWRPLRVRHPVTGQTFVDRFRLGTIRLSQVQPTLSLAKVEGQLLRAPSTGDHVLLLEGDRPSPYVAPDKTARGATPVPSPSPSAAPSTTPASANAPSTAAAGGKVVVAADPDAQALADLFSALEGSDPTTRANAYASFVKARPSSRFAKVLKEEIAALRAHPVRSTAEASASANTPPPFETSFNPIGRLRPGQPQRIALELDPQFTGAVIHVRRKGEAQYRSLPMESLGARYWAATLPGDSITEPGTEYFVEGVSNKGGGSVAVVGTASEPKDAAVEPHPVTGKDPGTLAQVSLASEYASFNTKAANDYVFQTEGAFGWRLRDVGIRAVRSGFGVLRGKGGTLQDLDQLNLPPKDVGLTYGYVETEVGVSPNYGLIARPILGLREGGVTGGAQAFLRVGNDLKTNLMVGGEVLGTVGLRGIVQLDWRTIPRVPVMLRSEVTNQPAGTGGDVGARAIAQVGYEIVRDLTLAARLSYQGRTINHAGPGAGLGVSYQW